MKDMNLDSKVMLSISDFICLSVCSLFIGFFVSYQHPEYLHI